jgi:DHA1 family multidrug resistance protein-like MFS transporter
MSTDQSSSPSSWLRDNLAILSASGFLSGIHTNMVSVVWQPFALSLGASIPMLGLLTSLGGFGGIVTSLVQPLGGWLSDRMGRKPFIVWSSVVLIAGYALYTLAGLVRAWAILIPGIILLGVSQLSRPARTSITAESVKAEQRGTGFSIVQAATGLPGIFAPVLGGFIADRATATAIFPACIVFEALALFIVARYLIETHAPHDRTAWADLLNVIKRSVIPPRGMAGFYLCIAGDSFVWGIGLGVLFGMFKETYSFSDAQLGAMTSAMSISMVLTQLPIGRLVDRYGSKPSMVVSELLGIPLMLLWAFASRWEVLVASYALFGLVGSTWGPAVMTYVAARIPAPERAEAMGRMSAFRGVLAFPSPFIGSLLYERGGIRLPILVTMAGIVVVTLGIAALVQEPRREPS